MTDDDVLEAMETYGGSFVQALALAYRRADPVNRVRLSRAFEDLWEQYRLVVAARRALRGRSE